MSGFLNMDRMPDNGFEKPKAGTRNFTIIGCQLVVSKTTGSKMIQFTHQSDAGEKVNYDNCPYEDVNGNPINFGQAKLKKYLVATKTEIKGDFQPNIVPSLLIGKKFNALAEPDEKGYLKINNIDTIIPVLENGAKVTPEMFETNEDVENVQLVEPDDEWK